MATLRVVKLQYQPLNKTFEWAVDGLRRVVPNSTPNTVRLRPFGHDLSGTVVSRTCTCNNCFRDRRELLQS